MTRGPARPEAPPAIPVVFEVGGHTLHLSMQPDWRWSLTVDGVRQAGLFMSQVEAWEAGVREAARLDQARGA